MPQAPGAERLDTHTACLNMSPVGRAFEANGDKNWPRTLRILTIQHNYRHCCSSRPIDISIVWHVASKLRDTHSNSDTSCHRRDLGVRMRMSQLRRMSLDQRRKRKRWTPGARYAAAEHRHDGAGRRATLHAREDNRRRRLAAICRVSLRIVPDAPESTGAAGADSGARKGRRELLSSTR